MTATADADAPMTLASRGVPIVPERIARSVVSAEAYGAWDDIHDDFAWLRENMPLGMASPEGFDPFWVATKHADIEEISRQPHIFNNNSYRTVLTTQALERAMLAPQPDGAMPFVRALPAMDPPEHSIYRRLTFGNFAPKGIRGLEDDIRALARESVDAMAATGGRCNFVDDVALRYPLRVILKILGIPREDEDIMLRMTQEFFYPEDPDLASADSLSAGVERTHGMEAITRLMGYFEALTESRRANPTQDIASTIANSRINGELIGSWEATSYYIVIATAGHDTTSSSTAGGLWALAQRPDQFARVKADRSLIPGLVDEAVRWTTAILHFMRTATQDYELRGQTIRAGDWIMLSYPSGNFDEEVFKDPREFHIDRSPNRHVGFGTGAHVCIGQHLAKMEMRIFFEELFERLESVELDGPPVRAQSTFIGGIKELPLKFTMR